MDDREVLMEQRPAPRPTPVRTGWAARLRRRPGVRWCWGTRLVVTASLGWLLFVLVHRPLSGRLVLWAPVDLIPPLLFAVIPLVLLAVAPFARPVRWRIMAVLVVAALLGYGNSGVNLATLWHTPPPAPQGAITVVAWNTEFWDQDWASGGGVDPDPHYRYLRDLDADVYLLQEYLHLDASATDKDDEAVRIDATARLRAEFPNHQIAVAGEQITLSRLPIVAQTGLDIRPWLPGSRKDIPSGLDDFQDSYTTETLRTDLLLGGQTVSFYNTHIHQPPHSFAIHRRAGRQANRENDYRRQASYRALRADIDDNPNSVVVGADLNTSPAMGISRLLPDGLVDHTGTLPDLYPASWAAGETPLWRVDWLLTSPDVSVHAYQLRDPAGLSDHRAQWSVLSVE
ncbi:endonuclease/exonuclease/phosphatase family protein [Micromonospora sp. NPDC049171]|uniref:endonuclease/exonuclease/phosphatase family protein n=1 Tax=Micromonospora sp. NPDC049171 TaxID=3155770 RepID=UPI0033E1D8C3